MKSSPEVVSLLQYAQEALEPARAALHQQDYSELFLSVAPGLAEEVYATVQEALHRTLERGWYAGRRGRISKLLIDVLGRMQQVLHTATAEEAAHHMTAAIEHLRHARAGLRQIAGHRPKKSLF